MISEILSATEFFSFEAFFDSPQHNNPENHIFLKMKKNLEMSFYTSVP